MAEGLRTHLRNLPAEMTPWVASAVQQPNMLPEQSHQ